MPIRLATPRRRRTLAGLGHAANDMYWFTLPSVLPVILVQYGLSYSAAGGLITAFLCATGVFSFVFGKASDRASTGAIISMGFFVASGCLTLAAVFRVPGVQVACMILAGVGVSTYHPVAYSLLDHAATSSRGRAFARFEMSGAAGLLPMVIAHGLLLERVGWRGVVVVTAVPGLIMAVVFFFHRKALEHGNTGSGHHTAAERRASPPRVALVVFVAGIVVRILGVAAAVNFLPTYLAGQSAVTPSLASFLVAFLFAGMLLVNFVSGRVADRWGPYILIGCAAAASGVLLFLATHLDRAWMLPVVLVFVGAGISAAIPGQNLILSSLTPRERKGEAYGILMGVMTLSNALGPIAFGAVADNAGLATALRIFALPIAVSVVVLPVVARLTRSHLEDQRRSTSA